MSTMIAIYREDQKLILQVAELASLAQLLPPCSPTVRNPAPDSSLKSCFSPIASASAAAPGPDCGIRFHCCVCLRLQLLLPIASASTATPRLRPLQLLLPDCVRFNCCSPDCVRFDCCSPIAYWIPAHAPAQCSRTFFAEFEVQ